MGKGIHNSFINQALANCSSFIVPILCQAEEELRGEVNMGAIDATVHKKKAREYDIRSFPTIKYFAPGDKQKSYFPALDAIEYEGGRTAKEIVDWVVEKLAEAEGKPKNTKGDEAEIDDSGSGALIQKCKKFTVCVILLLPNITHCDSGCRKKYMVSTLKYIVCF